MKKRGSGSIGWDQIGYYFLVVGFMFETPAKSIPTGSSYREFYLYLDKYNNFGPTGDCYTYYRIDLVGWGAIISLYSSPLQLWNLYFFGRSLCRRRDYAPWEGMETRRKCAAH
jgi:hypothetical protein